jgi:predicted TPR repeat methyltransferase
LRRPRPSRAFGHGLRQDENRLQLNGRSAHARRHVQSTVERGGLTLVELRPETLRMEAGLPVAGWVVTARKG